MCWKEPWLKASNKQNNRATAKPEYGKKEARLKPDVVNKFNLSFLKFVRCKVNIQVIIFNLHFKIKNKSQTASFDKYLK